MYTWLRCLSNDEMCWACAERGSYDVIRISSAHWHKHHGSSFHFLEMLLMEMPVHAKRQMLDEQGILQKSEPCSKAIAHVARTVE